MKIIIFAILVAMSCLLLEVHPVHAGARMRFYIVSTDLETNDLQFLRPFRKKLAQSKEKTEVLFIVGRGDAFIKKARMEKYIAAWQLPKNIVTDVILSTSSDDENLDDGKDCLSSEEIAQINAIGDYDRSEYQSDSLRKLEFYLDRHSRGSLILMKPFGIELTRFLMRGAEYWKGYDLTLYEGLSVVPKMQEKVLKFLSRFSNPPVLLSNQPVMENSVNEFMD